jgi:DNA modification methylase
MMGKKHIGMRLVEHKRNTDLGDFSKKLPQSVLDIEEKFRSNLFAWRGQFSPQLIDCLLDAYCPIGSTVLDPFSGSGTVLYEAAMKSFQAFGFEINPSAWIFSKLYEFANVDAEAREEAIRELRHFINREFPIVIFNNETLSTAVIEEKVIHIGESIGERAKTICSAVVVLVDIFRNPITNNFIQNKFAALVSLIRSLPFSEKQIKAGLNDARSLPLGNDSVDFVITSPPYINVFNYHQNYRRSVEVLGWDVLRVARSEIGSNRANRGNRFYTVVQYCIDMANAIREIARVLKPGAGAVFIVGYESNVLGTPFYNADIVEQIAVSSGLFEVVLRQKRVFSNRFGQAIREDILNLERTSCSEHDVMPNETGRVIAFNALENARTRVPDKNRSLINDAVRKVRELDGTPVFNSLSYKKYQTRDSVMMIRRIH